MKPKSTATNPAAFFAVPLSVLIGLLMAALPAPANAQSGQCQQGIERAQAFEANSKEPEPGGSIVASTCHALKLGIVAKWSNQQCANDPLLDASRRQQSHQQALIIQKSNEQLKKFVHSINDPKTPCDLGAVKWTGLVADDNTAKNPDAPDWEKLGQNNLGEEKQDAPDWGSLGQNSLGEVKQGEPDWDADVGQNADALRADIQRWNEAERRRKAEEARLAAIERERRAAERLERERREEQRRQRELAAEERQRESESRFWNTLGNAVNNSINTLNAINAARQQAESERQEKAEAAQRNSRSLDCWSAIHELKRMDSSGCVQVPQ